MLNRLGLGEDQAETAGSSTVLVHENVVSGLGRLEYSPNAQARGAQPSVRESLTVPQVNAVVFLSNGLLATASGKVVAMWDVNACAMKHTLSHEGTVSYITAMYPQ